jgi:Organic solute transporter Ostalpha
MCWNFLRCLNTFAVAILAGAVTFLFFQVQALQLSVKSDQEQINSLNSRLANQTNVQIQALTDAVNEEHAFTLYQMAGMFALLACLLTAFHMYSHLRNYKEPLVQRKIVTILWMSPIYAVTSFLSLIFPVADGYLAVIKDFYEGKYGGCVKRVSWGSFVAESTYTHLTFFDWLTFK